MSITPPSNNKGIANNTPARPNLLVVDDAPLNIQVMYHTFNKDYEVFGALNIDQAFEIASRVKVDLVLLDVDMPDMDGYQVCEALKANSTTCDIPVIFITAHTDPMEKSQGMKVGAVDFIYKPINPAQLHDRVKKHFPHYSAKTSAP